MSLVIDEYSPACSLMSWHGCWVRRHVSWWSSPCRRDFNVHACWPTERHSIISDHWLY